MSTKRLRSAARRSYLMRLLAALAVLAVLAVLPPARPAAAAGTEFAESGDAGDTVATAAVPGGAGALTRISGTVADGADADLFRICVTGTFTATSVNTASGGLGDPTLYVFDADGFGVVSNDDLATGGSQISGWPLEAGTYYVAISGFYNHPRAAVDPDNERGPEIFPEEPLQGSKGPSPGVGALDHWDGWGQSSGTYDIDLEGVSYCSGSEPVVTSSSPATGPRDGGTVLTIAGSGFTGATSVRVGAATASSFTVDSDTQITATTPARPECPTGALSVLVLGTGGIASRRVADATFSYDLTGCPTVTGLSPSAGVEGTSVVISGQNLWGATAVWFGTTPATSFSADSDSQVTAVAPALDQGAYDVVVATGVERSAATQSSRYESGFLPTVEQFSVDVGSPLGGTSVRVFGTEFDTATQVLFGTTPGTDLVANSRDLRVTAPALPSGTVVDVRVVTRYGTSATGPETKFSFRYAPHVAQLVPDSGPAAGGTPVVISGSEMLGATGVFFGDQRVPCPQLCSVMSRTQIYVQSPPHAVGGVTVRVDTPDGPSTSAPTYAFTGVGGFQHTGSCSDSCAASGAVLLPSGKVLGVNITQANIYDPLTGLWTKAARCADCPGFGSRIADSITLLTGPPSACGSNCGKVLAIGPSGAALYDPSADSWAATGAPPADDTSYFTSTLLRDGRVLNVRAQKAQIYDPLTGQFTATPDPLYVHSSHTATLLGDGRVLVAGGGGQSGPYPFTRDAEVYDPATNTWSTTGKMAQARFAHTATLLGNGKVLVSGGQIGFVAPITSSEIWDPATGTWSPTGDLVFPRSDHTASLLPDGRVLAIGGDEPTSDPVTNDPIGHDPTVGEVYDPGAQEWLPASPSNLYLDSNGIFGQSHNAWSVVLPPGPVSVCGIRCGQVLVIRSWDSDTVSVVPSAVLFAPPPRAALSPSEGPASGGTSITITGTGLASVRSVTFGGAPAASVTPDPTTPDTKVVAVAPAHAAGAVDVVVSTAGGAAGAGTFTFQGPPPPPATGTPPPATGPAPSTPPAATTPPVVIQTSTAPHGYSLVGGDGGVFTFGTLPFAGSLGALRPNQPIVGIEHTPTGKGYWLVGADGGVFAFGDATFRGSLGGIRLARPIVAMRSTASGNGYWLVGADGGVFAFGDATFRGSTGAMRLNSPVVGIERSGSGNGYWLTGADGGVFAFGDAPFRGSAGALRLAQPVVAMARSAGGAGYWLTGADGGVFAFGDATFLGSAGGLRLGSPVVGMAPTVAGNGYWLCARDGGVFAFGGASFLGSLAGLRPAQPVVGCAAPRGLAVT